MLYGIHFLTQALASLLHLVGEGRWLSGICQVHIFNSLQEVRLRWCSTNRTCESSITFHANLESVIPQSYLVSRVLIIVRTLASLKEKQKQIQLLVLHFPNLCNAVLTLLNN